MDSVITCMCGVTFYDREKFEEHYPRCPHHKIHFRDFEKNLGRKLNEFEKEIDKLIKEHKIQNIPVLRVVLYHNLVEILKSKIKAEELKFGPDSGNI